MAGINPFAKKTPVEIATSEKPIELPADSYLGAAGITAAMLGDVVSDALSFIARTPARKRGSWYHVTPDMRQWKLLSIRQRTRINRDHRNRERRYARYAAIMTRAKTHAEYA